MIKFLRKIKEDNLASYAAESAYYIILSIIPFGLVLISLLQYTNIDKITIINYADSIVPPVFKEITLNLIEEIYSKTITTLSISAIFTLWSASKGILAINKGIRKIYKIKSESYIKHRIQAVILTIIFTIILIIVLSSLVLSKQVLDTLFIKLNIQKLIPIKNILPAIILFLIFSIFYKMKENATQRTFLGSLFVTSSWYVLSYGFSIYMNLNKGFSILYGSLSSFILFMIWTYCLIYCIFIGAEINLWK